jgi:hypothetical protein
MSRLSRARLELRERLAQPARPPATTTAVVPQASNVARLRPL